jgi:putative drug exporter of the RND superfamily
MSRATASVECATPPFMARTLRRFAVAVILGWLAITVLVSVGVPSLDQVGKERSVSMSPKDAPSVQAMTHMGQLFKESNSDSVAMIVGRPDPARRFGRCY